MRATPIDLVEELVEDYYATIQLPEEVRETLEPVLRSDLEAYYAEARSEQAFLTTRRTRLLNERSKLLQAHYAGAVPLDLLKNEQSRIAGELDAITRRTRQTEDHQALVQENVRRALALASDCQAAYRGAPSSIRRLFNQFFFAKLLLDDETLRAELSPAFAALLTECRRATSADDNRATDAEDHFWETFGKTRDPEILGVASVKEPKLVAGAGFEPATSGL